MASAISWLSDACMRKQHFFLSFASNKGFTLLEVLVALVIVGTALGASLRAITSLTQNSGNLRTSMMATWSAENRLVQIRLEKQLFPEVGTVTTECPQGELLFVCEEQVVPTPNPSFRRVIVSVFESEKKERLIFKMFQLVPHD